MADSDVSRSELMQGIIQSANIAQNLLQAINWNIDVTESNKIIAQINKELGFTLENAQAASTIATWTGYNILKNAIPVLKAQMPTIIQMRELQAQASSAGYPLTASMYNAKMQLFSKNNQLDFYNKILYDLPMDYALTKVKKYFNKAFHTENPNERDLYFMAVNGMITPQTYLESFQEDLSYTETDARNLIELRYWQLGTPSLKEAWVMVQRGYWQKTDWLKLAQLGHGWTKDDAENYYNMLNYEPSLGDVMNLSNVIPLEPAWVAKKMGQLGLTTEDKNLFIAAMNKKTILQEIRSFWSVILAQYAYGGFTQEELRNLLVTWQFTTAEIDIKIATAELYKTKQVNQLNRDAVIYLYRAGTIAEANGVDGLYDRLVAQGIPAIVANAITRNEAAKKGADWELT